jgi:hypothetical protein
MVLKNANLLGYDGNYYNMRKISDKQSQTSTDVANDANWLGSVMTGKMYTQGRALVSVDIIPENE